MAWLYYDHVICPQALQAALNRNEASLGIHPERGLFADLRCASFISLGFYKAIDGTFVALPKVGRQLCRLFWTTTHLQGRDPRRLAATIATSFYPLYSTYPPMRKFLRYHMQAPPLGGKDWELLIGPTQFKWWEYTSRLKVPVNWAENHLAKYGPIGLLMDEIPLPAGKQGAGIINSPIVDWLYATDTADPCDRFGCISTRNSDRIL